MAGIDDQRILAEIERRRDFYDAVGNLGGDRMTVEKREALSIEERAAAEGGFVVRRPMLCGEDGAIDTGRVEPSLLLELLDGRTLSELFEGYVAKTGEQRSVQLGRALLGALANLAARDLIEVRARV